MVSLSSVFFQFGVCLPPSNNLVRLVTNHIYFAMLHSYCDEAIFERSKNPFGGEGSAVGGGERLLNRCCYSDRNILQYSAGKELRFHSQCSFQDQAILRI